MNYIGVDACKKGWFAVSIGTDEPFEVGIFESIADLWDSLKSNAMILIDIPKGSGPRRYFGCDRTGGYGIRRYECTGLDSG